MMDTMQQMLLLFAGLLKIQSLCSGRHIRNECFSAAFSFFIHLPLGCWVTDMGNTQYGLSLEASPAPLQWTTCGALAMRLPSLTALTYFLMIVLPVREQESSAQILPPTSGINRLTEMKLPSKTRQLILRFKKMRAQERQAWAVCFRHSLGKLFSIVCLPLWFCLFYSWIIVVWYYYDGSPYKGLSGTGPGLDPHCSGVWLCRLKKLHTLSLSKNICTLKTRQTKKRNQPLLDCNGKRIIDCVSANKLLFSLLSLPYGQLAIWAVLPWKLELIQWLK